MAGLLAELELAVRLVLVLVHVLQEVRSQGQWEWMRKIGVDHNTPGNGVTLQSAAAHLHLQEQRSRASPTTAESPHTRPLPQHSPPNPLSRPPIDSLEGGQADEAYTEDVQNGIGCRERSSRHLKFQLSREQVLVNLP